MGFDVDAVDQSRIVLGRKSRRLKVPLLPGMVGIE